MSGERIEPAPTEAAARGFFRDLTVASIASGLVAFLFAASGPVVVILATGFDRSEKNITELFLFVGFPFGRCELPDLTREVVERRAAHQPRLRDRPYL